MCYKKIQVLKIANRSIKNRKTISFPMHTFIFSLSSAKQSYQKTARDVKGLFAQTISFFQNESFSNGNDHAVPFPTTIFLHVSPLEIPLKAVTINYIYKCRKITKQKCLSSLKQFISAFNENV